MEQPPDNKFAPNKFRIGNIEKTKPVDGKPNQEWYKYTIVHASTVIKGKRSGTFKSVTEHLKDYVEKLNSRTYLGSSAYATRKNRK